MCLVSIMPKHLEPGTQAQETVLQRPVTLRPYGANALGRSVPVGWGCAQCSHFWNSYTHFFSPQFISPVFLEHLLNVRLCERHWRNTKMKKELGSTCALQDEAYSQAAQQVRLSDGDVCGLLSLFRAKTQNPAVSKS